MLSQQEVRVQQERGKESGGRETRREERMGELEVVTWPCFMDKSSIAYLMII